MRALLLVLFLLLPGAALAQDEDDGGFLTRMIERQLSSEGQKVRLSGFEGALSSQARFSRLTIADGEGIWLTIEGARLDWERSALLRGELIVTELSADRIDIERLPPGDGGGGGLVLPSPTSTAVNLPTLPVGIHIGRIAAGEVRLGPALLGEEVRATLEGSLELAGGEGSADITASRTDGRTGHLRLDAAFSNASRNLRILMELVEADDGILAGMLGLPGRPAVDFSIRGEAPISDFTGAIRLETGAVPRIAGQIRFMDLPGGAGLGWGLDLDGDVAPLFQDAYRPFFGARARLSLAGQNLADGGVRLDRLSVKSDELDLDGSLELAPGGMPRRFDLRASLHPSAGGAVLLPLPGAETLIGTAEASARFDAAAGDSFAVEAAFTGYARGGTAIGQGRVTAQGTIRPADPRQVAADLVLSVDGVALADPALDAALGGRLSGRTTIAWQEGGALSLRGARLAAGTALLQGDVALAGLGGNLRITTDAALATADLSPFSLLAGRELSGGANANVKGYYEPLGGAFDLTLDAATSGLHLGAGLVQDLAGGDGRFTGRLARGPEGTVFDNLHVATPQLDAVLSGTLGAAAGGLAFDARLADFALIWSGLPGPATAKGTLARRGEALAFDLAGKIPGGIDLTASGTAATDLATADATIDARMAEIAPLLPQFRGPLAATGRVQLAAGVLTFDLGTEGPEGASLHLAGDYRPADAHADLAVTGSADLALANRFADGAIDLEGQAALDLRLRGPLAAQSLSGSLSAQGARVVLPGAGITLPGADLALTLDPDHPGLPEAQLAARITARLPRIEAPGTGWLPLVSGPVDLSAEMALLPGMQVALRDLVLTDGDARVSGRADLGLAGDARAEADLQLALGDLARLRPLVPVELSGAAAAGLQARYDFAARSLDAVLSGTVSGLSAGPGPLSALLDPETRFAATLRMQDDALHLTAIELANGDVAVTGTADLAPLAASPVLRADLSATAASLARFAPLVGLPMAGSARARLAGQYAVAQATLDASVTGDLRGLSLGRGPAFALLAGDASLAARLLLAQGALTVEDARMANAALDVRGGYSAGRVDLDATLDSLGRLVPQLPGPVRVRGSVGIGGGYALDLAAEGPAGIDARVTGPVSAALVPDLSIRAEAPFGVANLFLPDSINVQGRVGADLTLARVLAAEGLAGTVTVSDGTVAIAGASLALTGLSARASLSGGTAEVEVATGFNSGGRAELKGSIGLSGAMPVDASLRLAAVQVVQEPTLRTKLDGALHLTGTVAGGGRLDGRIDLGETEISLALAGTGGGAVPEVQHLGEPPDSRATRARAGLLGQEGGGGGSGSGGGRLDLDILVAAPNRVFVRGRGLDAELGGELRLAGRAGDIIPIGAFELIRGRLDLLGRRFDLTEGSVQLQGDFDPQVRLVATTAADGVDVQIVTEGTASMPRVSLESSPDLPDEEVLALLLFGKSIANISAVQALQLAGAVRTLLSGGEGIQGDIRKRFGLDELDLATDDNGNVAVRAGKYLSENVYLDTAIDSAGDVDLQLNLDLTPGLTARGSVGSDGDTSLGIFFERDY